MPWPSSPSIHSSSPVLDPDGGEFSDDAVPPQERKVLDIAVKQTSEPNPWPARFPPPPPSVMAEDGRAVCFGYDVNPPPPPQPLPLPPTHLVHTQGQRSSEKGCASRRLPLPLRFPSRSSVHSPRRQCQWKDGNARGRHQANQCSDGPQLVSSTDSPNIIMRTTTWSSESSSESDGLLYRISRQFPPQFPAPASSHASILRSRSVATNRITAWVSQYENLQSIRETRRMATHPFPPSVDAGSAGDNSSFSGASSYAEVQLLWTRLKERRSKVGRIKTQMAQKRQELRQLRYRKDKADNEFMNVFRPVLARSAGYFQISVQELNSHVADMQDLRDEYHSQEEEYETLELLMDVEERELSALETTFFSLLAAGRTNSERVSPSGSNASESAKDNLPSEMPFELTGISADRALEDVHPLYLQLTRAVAYRQNAKEEYEDLLLLKKQYEYEADVQTKLGKGATNDTDEFLDEFPTEEARMKADVVKLGQRVDRLKRLCEDKKIMREHMSIGMVYALDPSIKFDDVQLDDLDAAADGFGWRQRGLCQPVAAPPTKTVASARTAVAFDLCLDPVLPYSEPLAVAVRRLAPLVARQHDGHNGRCSSDEEDQHRPRPLISA
ncbi:hypothetical protein DCS_04054 [Drechmeria coniospora]|uniref:Uncharacterized protein n=1 Tax=Drechmeria coniospora TaxID=98403 RepID=A0A151GIX1_DRECN|nr:hypothetical protein DCS_04054 [Drechmeria coniospora]KYK57047.1 hypothetical protein DCS_04054 [Drechmeria coniospora]